MIGLVILVAAAAIATYWHWRAVVRPALLHGCPLCPERVWDVATHLVTAHHGEGWMCHRCHRWVEHDHSEAHWRLWHQPRPAGPEDRQDWRRA